MKDLRHQVKIEVQEVRNFLIRMSATNVLISDEDILAYVTNAHKPLSVGEAMGLAEIDTKALSRREKNKVVRKFRVAVDRVDSIIGGTIWTGVKV